MSSADTVKVNRYNSPKREEKSLVSKLDSNFPLFSIHDLDRINQTMYLIFPRRGENSAYDRATRTYEHESVASLVFTYILSTEIE